jgi:hypothetical protein
VATLAGLYAIRIRGRLGATAVSVFPSMVSELKDGETVLTGLLEDRSALFGALAQIEALGFELLELRQIRSRPKSPGRRFPLTASRVRLKGHRQTVHIARTGRTSVHDNRNSS